MFSISHNSVNIWNLKFLLFGFFSLFKLVYLGELRLVYLSIWACLIIQNKLFDLFLLPFGLVSLFLFYVGGLVRRKKPNIKDSVYTCG